MADNKAMAEAEQQKKQRQLTLLGGILDEEEDETPLDCTLSYRLTAVDEALSVIIPAPGYTLAQALANPDVQASLDANQSAGQPVQIEDTDLPADRMFRGAWTLDGSACIECPVKSEEVAHDICRQMRVQEFAPHDKVVALQLPGAVEAEAERVAIRAKYATMQSNIDAALTVVDLRGILTR